jgi:hypothetical protein
MTTKWSNRQLMALLILALIALFILFAGAFMTYADVPPDLPLYNVAKGSILKMDKDTYRDMIGHVINTGEGDIVWGAHIWLKTYHVGRAVPKHGTLPHELYVDFLVVPPFSQIGEVQINLRYRIEMGGGYIGHTILNMSDKDFDLQPDSITRRYARSLSGRFYTSGQEKWKTPIYDANLPVGMPEWNEWMMWFYNKFKEEGAFATKGRVM